MSEHIDVLVIGNGFDLAHGLKTSYKDFSIKLHCEPIKDILNELSYIISEESIQQFRNLEHSFREANDLLYHNEEDLLDLIRRSKTETYEPFYQTSPGKYSRNPSLERISRMGAWTCYFNKLCEEKLVLKIKDINKGLGDIKNEVIEKFKQEKELNEETRLDLQKKISEIKEKLKELEENNVYLEWFDIEKEIYEIIVQCNQQLSEINNTKNTTNGLFNPYDSDIIKRFIDHVRMDGEKQAIVTLNFDLRAFIADFYKHLYKETLGDDIQKLIQKPKFKLFLEKKCQTHKLRVLNFNYTKTFEKLYAEDLKKKGFLFQDNHIIHIHGFIYESVSTVTYKDVDKMNLVLGTQLFTDENNIHPDFRIFTKDYQRHHYKTIKGYETLLEELNDLQKGSVTFHVIGHSLNNIDHEVLKPMLCIQNTAVRNSSINVYYHDEKSKEDLENHMTNIIGKEKRVTFINQHDKGRGGILQRINEE